MNKKQNSDQKIRLFSNFDFKDFIVLSLLIIVTIVASYFYTNTFARSKIWQQTYPIRADLSLNNLSCSDNAPKWMSDILTTQTLINNAPSNQIAYIDRTGKLHHCENGYVSQYPLLSASVNPDTRFRYASITKLWTSDKILDLVKKNKIALDDPLATYITEIDKPIDSRINDITIEQLLLHRGGFDRTSVFGHDMFNIGEQFCPGKLEQLNHIKLNFSPDSKMSYSNLGYCLLGEVISRVEGKAYTQVIKDDYKLQSNSLAFVGNNKLEDEVFYNYIETGLTGVPNIYTEFDYNSLASSAGLSGNAIDLAQQVHSMAIKTEPNIKTLDDDIGCKPDVLRDCYGYAMFPYSKVGSTKTVFYRDGTLLGLSSLVVVSQDNQVVSLLSNGTPANGTEDTDKIKMMIYDSL